MSSPSGNSTEESKPMSDSDTTFEDYYDNKEEQRLDSDAPKSRVDPPDADKTKSPEDATNSDCEKKPRLPCAEELEEQTITAKYGRLTPKKPPLISKDHDHAFFDSADWALGKQGAQKSKGPLEALRPKLQPSPHHHIRSRRSTYAFAGDDGEGHEGSNDNCKLSDEDQIRHGFPDDVHSNSPCQET